MKFLSNTHNPFLPDTKKFHCFSFHAIQGGPEACEEEWRQHMDWIKSNLIGRPQASKHYTVEQLEDMGLVGIYAEEK